ncbi:MAG: UDP-2,4-diacetamido-2,4,6-trideoxy-beta-L-altropyranose hydrolase [Planctomycetota bacterium]
MAPWSVILRADGSSSIGIGHVMRCLSLAAGIRRAGGKPLLLTRSGPELERGSAVPVELLAEGLAEAQDAASTLEAARAHDARLVVVDHYALGPGWWERVASRLSLLVIDDEGRPGTGTEVDLVLNPNMGARTSWYPGRALCGARYALLREEFLARRSNRETHGTVRRILVTLGGADPENLSPMVLRSLARVSGGIEIDLVIGPAFRDQEAIMRQAGLDRRVRVQGGELATRMAEADLAITAGGSTLYECACLGLPALVIQTAPNQGASCRAMAEAGVILFLGPASQTDEAGLGRSVELLSADPTQRARMREAGMMLVDGRGAERVAWELARLVESAQHT